VKIFRRTQAARSGVRGKAGIIRLIARAIAGSAALIVVVVLPGCANLVSGFTGDVADNLSDAIVNQDDPALVREALPAYLLLLDSFVKSDPGNAKLLGAAAQLYAAYGTAFVREPERAGVLTARARDYGNRSLCAAARSTCALESKPFDDYVAVIQSVKPTAADPLYSYCVGNLAYIRAHSDDYQALADLPKVEKALEHLLAIGAGDREVSVNTYLGILNTLRPEALGGRPDLAREYFERAIELSEGRDLAVKVEFARGYARLLYERELHDHLLNEVLQSDVEEEGMTLSNLMAQDEAEALLATADDYF